MSCQAGCQAATADSGPSDTVQGRLDVIGATHGPREKIEGLARAADEGRDIVTAVAHVHPAGHRIAVWKLDDVRRAKAEHIPEEIHRRLQAPTDAERDVVEIGWSANAGPPIGGERGIPVVHALD